MVFPHLIAMAVPSSASGCSIWGTRTCANDRDIYGRHAKRVAHTISNEWVCRLEPEGIPALSLQHPIFHPVRCEVLAELLLHHGFVIGPVTQVHLRLAVAFEGDNVRADAVEEPAVVAHDDGCPGELFKGGFERTQ